MFTGTPRGALEFQGHFPDLFRLFVVLDELFERGLLLDGLGQRHAHFERDQLGELVTQRVGLALGTGHVAHHRLGGHGAEGDDLRNRVAAIAVGYVLDDLVTLLHAEIDVKVGHRDTLRVKKALEQQIVADGVEVGDLLRVGH